jgi:hypothetical protein
MGRRACIARILFDVALLVGVMVGQAAAAPSTTVSAVFDGRQPEMPNRVFRDGSPTTCVMEAFPGVFATSSFWQSFPFCNTGDETCFTASFDRGTCGNNVHLMAYINRFDPNNLAMNYAGDVGASNAGMFSFVIPAGEQFLIVAQTNFGMADCAFGFTVDAMRCAAPAPTLSRFATLLALGLLSLVAAGAMRRSRHGLTVLILGAVIAAFAGPAAAPIAADPTPRGAHACALDCSAAYEACATEQCESGSMDKNPDCLTQCRRSYDACVATCP